MGRVIDLSTRILKQYLELVAEIEALASPREVEARRSAARAELRRECSLEILDADAGPCVLCCREVGAGLIGWCWQPESGPLCDSCLGGLDVDLAAMLVLIQRAREIAAAPSEESAISKLLALSRRYAEATAGAFRGTRELAGELEQQLEHLEDVLGQDWLSEVGGTLVPS